MSVPDSSDRATNKQVDGRPPRLISHSDPEDSDLATSKSLADDGRLSPHVTVDAPPVGASASSPEEEGRARLIERLRQHRSDSTGVLLARGQLGHFRLLAQIGAGGMGEVFRAEDITDGHTVAIKVLRADLAEQMIALQRFHKEARLLAEVQSPHIVQLIEINEEDGVHYLVMEYVPGESLAAFVRQHGPLPERLALQVACEIARGLAVAHEQGIVHRDIKPENILLQMMDEDGTRGEGQIDSADLCREREARNEQQEHAGLWNPQRTLRPKLTDFGLARHVVESDSLHLTRTGAILGTPYYMSPEQCLGQGSIDARTDVYSLGATLFCMLAARPPFIADNPLSLVSMHCNDPPPAIEKLNANVSAALGQIIQKTLSKNPDARYANAADLLNDLERVLRGEPTSIVAHPRLPACDANKVLEFNWTWQLAASPTELWPHVSNTERLNRAIGLPAPTFTTEAEPDGQVKRFARIRSKGIEAVWQEHPFEWIEGRRFGVLREFSKGPFRWYTSVVELEPGAAGGTLLTHRLQVEPNGLFGRTAGQSHLNS